MNEFLIHQQGATLNFNLRALEVLENESEKQT
jgi:hypothetical protein